MNYTVVWKKDFEESIQGVSMFSGDLIEVVGEQLVKLEDGRLLEQYLYNIVGYTAENGKQFASLKANISLFN